MTETEEYKQSAFIASHRDVVFQHIESEGYWKATGTRLLNPGDGGIGVTGTCIGETPVAAYCNLQNYLDAEARNARRSLRI